MTEMFWPLEQIHESSLAVLLNVPAGQDVHVPVDEGWVAQLLEVIMMVGVFVPYVPGRHGRVM